MTRWRANEVGTMDLLQGRKLYFSSQDESGQTMVEYVLMILLLALVVVLAIPAVAENVSKAFLKIASFVERST